MKKIALVLMLVQLAGCATERQREGWKKVAAIAAVGAVVYGAARYGGGGYSAPVATDYDWDWDEFYMQSGQLVWACRGVQTGQFAEQWRCASKWKADYRWPGK